MRAIEIGVLVALLSACGSDRMITPFGGPVALITGEAVAGVHSFDLATLQPGCWINDDGSVAIVDDAEPSASGSVTVNPDGVDVASIDVRDADGSAWSLACAGDRTGDMFDGACMVFYIDPTGTDAITGSADVLIEWSDCDPGPAPAWP